MIEIRNLADEVKVDRSALLKKVKKLGIIPQKVNRQTETGVQPVSCVTDDEAHRVRMFYLAARN